MGQGHDGFTQGGEGGGGGVVGHVRGEGGKGEGGGVE